MPIKGQVRYRVKTTAQGKKVRLAFDKKGEVVEAKNLDTGAKHTQKEFVADRKKRAKHAKGT